MGKDGLLGFRAVVGNLHTYIAIISEQTRDVVLVGILEIRFCKAFRVVRVIGLVFPDDILDYTLSEMLTIYCLLLFILCISPILSIKVNLFKNLHSSFVLCLVSTTLGIGGCVLTQLVLSQWLILWRLICSCCVLIITDLHRELILFALNFRSEIRTIWVFFRD